MAAYLLGFDIGSSSGQAALVDAPTGSLVASITSADQKMTILDTRPEWSEQHPKNWWQKAMRPTQWLKQAYPFQGAQALAISLACLRISEAATITDTPGVFHSITQETSYARLERILASVHVNSPSDDPHQGVLTRINGTGIRNGWLPRLVGNVPHESLNQLVAQASIGAERIPGNANPGTNLSGHRGGPVYYVRRSLSLAGMGSFDGYSSGLQAASELW